VPVSLRQTLLALAIAASALLVSAPLSPAAAGHRVARSEHRPAVVRTDLAGARSLGKRSRCTARISQLRARRRIPVQRRRRIVRRLRGTCQATQSSAPHAPLYWGATIGDQLTGEQAPWDMGAVDQFEGLAGKGLSLVNFFAPFANCDSSCYFYKFPTEPMESIREHGAIPVFSWSSQSIPSSLDEPDFQLGDVISGRYDSYIQEFAEDAKEWGHPFFLRFNWEMNGNWFPWSEGVNGNQPGEYVAAWRHVHDIFRAVGATNATWVWCPNVDPEAKMLDLAGQYPGDEYVDWTGLDGYNWGPGRSGEWASFNGLYSSTYTAIAGAIAPSKPMLIGEIGSTEHGGSKADWISEALSSILTGYPQIRGMLWFDTFDDGMDWPIETSPGATSAFAAGVQDPAFRSDSYADLPAGAIAPPS